MHCEEEKSWRWHHRWGHRHEWKRTWCDEGSKWHGEPDHDDWGCHKHWCG